MATPVDYRYFLIDLVAPYPVIGELQFTNVTWGLMLNGPGGFNGTININDLRLQNTVGTAQAGYVSGLEYITQPGRVGLYIERNRQIVWGGIVWTRTWSSAEQTLTIEAKTFDSYFEHRLIRDAKFGTGLLTFDTTTDQFQVFVGVNGILDNMDSDTQQLPNGAVLSGDIGIDYDSTALSGVTIPGAYTVWDYEHKQVSAALSELALQTTTTNPDTGATYRTGFDWAVNTYYDNAGNFRRTFTMYYPSKGNSTSDSSIRPVLDFPGSVVSYEWPEDGTSMVTLLHGIGPGTGDGQYTSYKAPSTRFSQARYPMLEDVAQFTQIPEPNTVDALTQARADALSRPVYTPTFMWLASWQDVRDSSYTTPLGPAIGSFTVGDLFRVVLNDSRFYGGVEFSLRLTEFTVSVGDNGQAEVVTGNFSLPTY